MTLRLTSPWEAYSIALSLPCATFSHLRSSHCPGFFLPLCHLDAGHPTQPSPLKNDCSRWRRFAPSPRKPPFFFRSRAKSRLFFLSVFGWKAIHRALQIRAPLLFRRAPPSPFFRPFKSFRLLAIDFLSPKLCQTPRTESFRRKGCNEPNAAHSEPFLFCPVLSSALSPLTPRFA